MSNFLSWPSRSLRWTETGLLNADAFLVGSIAKREENEKIINNEEDAYCHRLS